MNNSTEVYSNSSISGLDSYVNNWNTIIALWEGQLADSTEFDSSTVFSDDEYGLLNTAKFVMFEQPWHAAANRSGANSSSSLAGKVGVISQSPSQYQTWSIVCLATLMTAMMIVIVVGNMLVLIAIATENNLSNIQNWFIASLAVADMLIGLVIMPFSLSYMLMGYWMFGTLWCEVHGAMDVFLCTSSIMNICLISLDRYWSITRAVEYINSRTPKMVNSLIVTCWVLSGTISIPPLLGWKQDEDQSWFWNLLAQQGNRTQLESIRDLEMSGQIDLENFTQTLETIVYPQCGVSHTLIFLYRPAKIKE